MIRAFLLILALATSANAAQVGDCVVVVGGCSGVCVDPAGLVLTVKHCSVPEVTQVKFRDRVVMARKVYETTECDGPVMLDCDGDGYPFVPVASIVPPAGSPVWSAGYPAPSRNLVWASGKLLGSTRWRNNPRDCGVLVNEVNFVAAEGWSGGPLFTQSNEVCGLLFGGDKRASFFCSFSAVRAAMDFRQPLQPIVVVDAKPTLYVFTSKACQPCTQFKNDYAGQPVFKAAINAAYTVQFVDIDQQPGEATRRGVKEVPAFVRDGKATITGYTTPDSLLVALGLKAESVVERPSIPVSTPIAPPVAPPTPTQPIVDRTPTLGDRLDKLTGLVSTGLSVASWLGLTGATGGVAGAVLGGVALWRTYRKAKQVVTGTVQQQPPQVPPAPPTIITTETAPLPQAVLPETRFAAYERDTFAEAFAWAEGQMAQKYPGSVSTLETIRSLISQYLSAKGIRPTA